MLITFFGNVVFKSYLYKKINRDSIPTRVRVFFDTQRVDSNTHPPLLSEYKVGRSLLFQCWYYTPPFVKSLSPIYSIYPYRSPLLLNKDTIKVSYMQIKSVKICTIISLNFAQKKRDNRPPRFRIS
jgi:hypothetical protein